MIVDISMIGPTPHVQPSTVRVGGRNADEVVGLKPNGGTLAAGWKEGLQTNGRMVRVITFQSSFT